MAKASASTVAKATAKAVGGDVYGALISILKDRQIRNAIICAVVLFAFLLVGIISLVGSAIVGAAESICSTWSENYDEAWINAGIDSSGSAIYMFLSSTYEGVFTEAMAQTVNDVFRSFSSHTVDGSDAANSDADTFGETDTFTTDDAIITLQSITDEEALTGANGAIMRRLDMIKKRVRQRGYQIEKSARANYQLRSYGYIVALWLQNSLANPFLFRGYDESASGITIDTSAFQLTDLQALKILCAYSIQYDCNISEVDMWSLMDYCGWYDIRLTQLPAPDLDTESIYADGSATAIMSEGLTGVIESGTNIIEVVSGGTDISGNYIIPFGSLTVPYWRGTFVPQWVVEERAAIQRHNENYWKLKEAGATITEENEKWGTQATADSEITGFRKLDAVYEFGLIDKIFQTSQASMTVSAHNVETNTGILDTIINAIPAAFQNAWYTAFPAADPTEYYDSHGHYITLDSINCGTMPAGTYVIRLDGSSHDIREKKLTSNGTLQFSNLSQDTTYVVYRKVTTRVRTLSAPAGEYQLVTLDRQSDTAGNAGTDKTYEYSTLAYHHRDPIYSGGGGGSSEEDDSEDEEYENVTRYEQVCRFTTAKEPETRTAQSYQIGVNVNISFSALSVDDLIYDTIGLWTGSLSDVTETASGIYQAGQEDNDLLLYEWTDSYVDESGVTHKITFNRQQGYQAEAYRDSVSALAELIGLESEGLYSFGNSWQGQDIVSVALEEIESYTGTGGAKFWNAYGDYTGVYYNPNTAWCCCFVWYCALQCGYLSKDGNGCFGSSWHINCRSAYNAMAESLGATCHQSSDYIPNPGDLVFFGSNSYDLSHIGIVVEVMDDGTMLVAEGNHSNQCKLTINSSYKIGTEGACTKLIRAYASPRYPTTTSVSNDWLYTQIPGRTQPTAAASNIGTDTASILIAGQFRMTQPQIIAFGKWLSQQDTDLLLKPEAAAFTQAAREEADNSTLADTWNALALVAESEFTSLQTQYAENYIALPIVRNIYTRTGFNWTSSSTRLEVLWAIATATPNSQAATQVLTAITTGLRDNASDGELQKAVQERMPQTIESYSGSLWQGYPDELKEEWIETFRVFAESLKGGDSAMADVGSGSYRNMTSSQELVDVIKSCEGFLSTAYWDYAQWTIGYGTRADSPDQVVTPAQAERMLKNYLKTFEEYVNKLCRNMGKQPTQGQFDALVSFTYNLGPAWTTNPNHKLVQQLKNPTNEMDFVNVLGQYCHAGGEVLYALTQRRILEAIMFTKGEYYLPWNPSPASDYNIKSNLPVANFGSLPYYSVVIYQYDYSTTSIAKGMGHEVHYYPVGEAYGTLPSPTRAGYVFTGWKITRVNNIRTSAGRTLTSGTKVENVLEATATWTR